MSDASRGFAVVVVGLSAACGSGSKMPDADIDTPEVRVTALSLTGEGPPDPSTKIVFQDLEDNVILDSAIDAMGRAHAKLPGGGTVSAIRVHTNTDTSLVATIETVRGVQPGDDLTLGLEPPATITDQGGQTTMTASFSPVADADLYAFYTPCGGVLVDAPPVTLTFHDSCHGASFDLLAIAAGERMATPVFLTLTNIAYQSGGSFTIPGGFSTMGTFTVHLSNVADAVSAMGVSRSSMIGNTPVAIEGSDDVSDPPAGTVSRTLAYPPDYGTRSEVEIGTRRADADSWQAHQIHTATLAPDVSVELRQLPWFGSVAMTPTGGTWSMVAPGDAPDGMLTLWLGRWMVGPREVSLAWWVAQPADMAGMTLPHLPPAYVALDPGRQVVPITRQQMTVTMVDLDNVAGYDEFRQMAETLTVPSIGAMGAFVGMPFQRRVSTMVGRP